MSEVWSKWQGRFINGAFPLHRYLGSSDHSGVYLTELPGHPPTEVAIKLVRAITPFVDLHRTQWETAAGLAHPGLMRLLETGPCQLDGQPYLYVVMEHADQTLAQLLEKRALSYEEAREMMLPVLDVLTFLHNRNLVQGQLKPTNILVVGDQLKLASDTVRGVSEATANINMVSVYDPPEIHDGVASTASDMWALGVTLFEALTRKPPMGLDVRRERVVLPADFPPVFRDIVAGCLSRRPFDRPKAGELAARLRGVDVAPADGSAVGSRSRPVTGVSGGEPGGGGSAVAGTAALGGEPGSASLAAATGGVGSQAAGLGAASGALGAGSSVGAAMPAGGGGAAATAGLASGVAAPGVRAGSGATAAVAAATGGVGSQAAGLGAASGALSAGGGVSAAMPGGGGVAAATAGLASGVAAPGVRAGSGAAAAIAGATGGVVAAPGVRSGLGAAAGSAATSGAAAVPATTARAGVGATQAAVPAGSAAGGAATSGAAMPAATAMPATAARAGVGATQAAAPAGSVPGAAAGPVGFSPATTGTLRALAMPGHVGPAPAGSASAAPVGRAPVSVPVTHPRPSGTVTHQSPIGRSMHMGSLTTPVGHAAPGVVGEPVKARPAPKPIVIEHFTPEESITPDLEPAPPKPVAPVVHEDKSEVVIGEDPEPSKLRALITLVLGTATILGVAYAGVHFMGPQPRSVAQQVVGPTFAPDATGEEATAGSVEKAGTMTEAAIAEAVAPESGDFGRGAGTSANGAGRAGVDSVGGAGGRAGAEPVGGTAARVTVGSDGAPAAGDFGRAAGTVGNAAGRANVGSGVASGAGGFARIAGNATAPSASTYGVQRVVMDTTATGVVPAAGDFGRAAAPAANKLAANKLGAAAASAPEVVPVPPPADVHEEIPQVPERTLRTIRGHVRVTVRLIVDKDGNVFAALVDQRGPSRYFERIAIEAAKKWTFPPLDTAESRLELVRFDFTRQGATGRAVEIE